MEEVRAKFSKGLTQADGQAIREIVPTVVGTAAQAEVDVEATSTDKSSKVKLVGVSGEFGDILNFQPSGGTFLKADHHDRELRVCVLGAEVARALFPISEPIGQQVKLGDQWLR